MTIIDKPYRSQLAAMEILYKRRQRARRQYHTRDFTDCKARKNEDKSNGYKKILDLLNLRSTKKAPKGAFFTISGSLEIPSRTYRKYIYFYIVCVIVYIVGRPQGDCVNAVLRAHSGENNGI